MLKHIKNYTKHFNIGEQDIIQCEYCRCSVAVDIHHIVFKSQGGSDEIENLIALCRNCHNLAHNKKISTKQLYENQHYKYKTINS